VVLGGLDDWRAGLIDTGVEVLSKGTEDRVDLVVAPAKETSTAVACGAPMLILEGRLPRSVSTAGFHVQRLLARPDSVSPGLLLPLEQRQATSYAIAHWSIVDHRWKLLRRAVAYRLARNGLWPPIGSIVTVCQNDAVAPAIIDAARALGLPHDVEWVLSLGRGDVLSRNVFHVFRRGEDEPDWVLKFARVRDYSEPFDRDERGLELAAAAGGLVAAHAPRLLGRFTWNGIHASVETAGRGYRLRELLTSPLRRREKLQLIDTVASWIVAIGSETASSHDGLTAERERLLKDVVQRWTDEGASASLVVELPDLPPVLQHNDLGSWNVIVRDSDFTVVDWESSRRHGLPLWDLFYFLADSLALLDGETAGDTRHVHTTALFRGEAASSEILFRWTRAAVSALAVPPETVGSLATLCWLHHSLSHVHRRDPLDRFAPTSHLRLHGTELVAPAWLADPVLGPNWDRWRR